MHEPIQSADDVLSEEESRRRELLALARRPSYRQILSDLEGVSRSLQLKRELVDPSQMQVVANLVVEASTSNLPPAPSDSRSAAESPNATSSSGSTSPSFSDHAATGLPQNLPARLDNVNNNTVNFTDLSSSVALIRFQQHAQQSAHNLMLPISNDVHMSLKALSELSAFQNAAAVASQRSAANKAALNLEAATTVILESGLTATLNQAQTANAQYVTTSVSPFGDKDVKNHRVTNVQESLQNTMSPRGSNRPVEEVHRKREVRLLKNREAAKECRRKKKEYIKCLENRVNTLEHQNTQLIEELKNLKALYCRKAD